MPLYPVDAMIEHATSRARQPVRVTDKHQDYFEIHWPLQGVFRFSASTGRGTGRMIAWRLPVDELRRLRDDPEFVPSLPAPRKVTTHVDVPREPDPVDTRQPHLFVRDEREYT